MDKNEIMRLTGWKIKSLPIGDVYIDPGNHGAQVDDEPLITMTPERRAWLKARERK